MRVSDLVSYFENVLGVSLVIRPEPVSPGASTGSEASNQFQIRWLGREWAERTFIVADLEWDQANEELFKRILLALQLDFDQVGLALVMMPSAGVDSACFPFQTLSDQNSAPVQVVIFGDTLAGTLLAGQSQAASTGQMGVRSDVSGCSVVTTHSLRQIRESAERKRAAWQHLQFAMKSQIDSA